MSPQYGTVSECSTVYSNFLHSAVQYTVKCEVAVQYNTVWKCTTVQYNVRVQYSSVQCESAVQYTLTCCTVQYSKQYFIWYSKVNYAVTCCTVFYMYSIQYHTVQCSRENRTLLYRTVQCAVLYSAVQ